MKDNLIGPKIVKWLSIVAIPFEGIILATFGGSLVGKIVCVIIQLVSMGCLVWNYLQVWGYFIDVQIPWVLAVVTRILLVIFGIFMLEGTSNFIILGITIFIEVCIYIASVLDAQEYKYIEESGE